MRINKDTATYKPPFSVVLLDATDAYYYADVMDRMEEVTKVKTYEKAVAIADALFVVKNYGWESLQAMNDVDGGHDVRVYDSAMSCVHAAHTKYTDKWIGEGRSDITLFSAIQKAIRFSTKTHEVYQKQKRKGKDIPYIIHPLAVGLILARAGVSEDVIVAGILHDTIEDSIAERKVTREMLAERFGDSVAALVQSVTETNKELPWEERKQEALAHVPTFSHDSLLVKSADIISNASELIEDYKTDGEIIFSRFNAPKDKMLKHYLAIIDAVCGQWRGNPLMSDLAEVRIQLSRILALGEGDLHYAEWSISFVEYEMERIFSKSKFKPEIMNLCADFHAAVSEYTADSHIEKLDVRTRAIAAEFHKIIKTLDGNEKEQMVQFLLTSHMADVLTSLNEFMATN